MRIIDVRNVNRAYAEGMAHLRSVGESSESRAGRVRVAPTPVMTVYRHPQERVLFDARRDANPFFHLFESIWMLAGSDDAKWLDQFVGKFSERYGEGDGIMHGAYGRRWRSWFMMSVDDDLSTFDQLSVVVGLLRNNPDDRQCVIQMWDAEEDLGVEGLRDRPCNTQIYLRVTRRGDLTRDPVLDLTVTCRSNDIVYGAYGANAVHFSVLQEYLAAAIGVGIGTMYQFSNNWHGYEDVLDKMVGGDFMDSSLSPGSADAYVAASDLPYVVPLPMVTVPSIFLEDCETFVGSKPLDFIYGNPWFESTAKPMLEAHHRFREKEYDAALDAAMRVKAEDWSLAARRWISRRVK